MKLKARYTGSSPLLQLGILLISILVGAIIFSIIGAGVLLASGNPSFNLIEHPDILRFYQFISAILTFLLPALFTAWVCGKNIHSFLYINPITKSKVWILTFISIVLFSPFITLTGLWNRQMQLPDFMRPIEIWMQSQEALAEQLTQALLQEEGIFVIISNLIVVAVTAAITEEFLFRGALQRIIGKWTRKPHVTIWITAILFSAFHMQFYGFLPRLLLGAYFGYLLYWSRSIWLPVFAHFINNAFAVIAMSTHQLKDNEYINGEIPDNEIATYTIWAFVMLSIFLVCTRHLHQQLKTSD